LTLVLQIVMEAEFVMGHLDSRWPKYFHPECAASYGRFGRNLRQYMMNNFFRGVTCSRCGVKLQCKCNPYRISEAETGDCKHGVD
jgi:hypothetical protein